MGGTQGHHKHRRRHPFRIPAPVDLTRRPETETKVPDMKRIIAGIVILVFALGFTTRVSLFGLECYASLLLPGTCLPPLLVYALYGLASALILFGVLAQLRRTP